MLGAKEAIVGYNTNDVFCFLSTKIAKTVL